MATPAPTWRVVYANYAGVKYAELTDISSPKYSFPLYQARTIRGKIPIHSIGGVAMMQNGGEGLLFLYQDNVLRMTCEVTTMEVVGSPDEKSIAFVGTETMWARLSKRLIGISQAGYSISTATDKGAALVTLLNSLNTTAASGLTATSTASSTIAGGPWRYKPYTDLMTELAMTLNGFEWEQTPIDPASVAGTTGQIAFKARVGSAKPNVVFEYGYGTRANLREYRWITDTSNLVNLFYNLPPGYPDTGAQPVVVGLDLTSYVAKGRRDYLLESDLTNQAARQALCDQHVAIRKNPRQTFEFQPVIYDGTGRVPRPIVDYKTGDTIRGRVKDEGVLMLEADVRIYNIDVEPDAQGAETVTLTVIRE